MNNKEVKKVRDDIIKAFYGLNFDEPTHIYSFKGCRLSSTSSFLKRYTGVFPARHMAKVMAEKFTRENPKMQRDASYYLNRWSMMGRAAAASGTRIHNYAEYNYPTFPDRPVCEQEEGVIEFFERLPDYYVVLFMELRMYIKRYRKAGTADLILLNKKTGKIVIADWKTNSRNLLQYYKSQKLKKPFDNLYKTKLNTYALQLSDYQNMLELKTNYEVEDRWIIHLSNKDHTLLDKGKEDKAYKYKIDKVKPNLIGKNFKIYRVPDYSPILLKEYEKLLAGYRVKPKQLSNV